MATVKIKRTSAGLKDALFEAIEALRSGDIDPNEAKQIAALSKEIVSVTRLEMDVFNYQMTMARDTDAPIPAIELGVTENATDVPSLQGPVQGRPDADGPEVSAGEKARDD